MTFKQAKERLDKLANGKYRSLSYDLFTHRDGEQESTCRVYIDSYPSGNGSTWSEAFRALRREMNPPKLETIPNIEELETQNDPQTSSNS